MDRVVREAKAIAGRIRVPGDKSISHRVLILWALARGETEIRGLSPRADVRSTRECLAALGVGFAEEDGAVVIQGTGPEGARSGPGLRELRDHHAAPLQGPGRPAVPDHPHRG